MATPKKQLQGKNSLSKIAKTKAQQAREEKLEEMHPGFAEERKNPPTPKGLKPVKKTAAAEKATGTVKKGRTPR